MMPDNKQMKGLLWMKRVVWTFMIFMIGVTLIYFDAQDVRAEAREIHVYFEGERLTFEDTEPILIDNRTMVPFRKIFETLGFEVEWIDGELRKAIGSKEGMKIELTIDSNKAIINGQTIELDVPAQIHKGRTLVPLRFVSENSGYHVYFADQAGTFIVGIGSTVESANLGVTNQPTVPVSSSGDIEPYVAKGRVVNAQGQPLPSVEVYADNTFLYNSNILGITDEKGEYRLELPEVNTSYRMGAKYEIDDQGKTYTFYMEPEPNHPFNGSAGAVRDFVLDINLGEVELYSWDYAYPDDDNAPEFEMDQVELSLKPVGKLIDSSMGRTITGFPKYEDGVRMKGIPVGTYEVTAVWKPKGYKPVPLLVSIRNAEQFNESVMFNFENPFGDYHHVQLEVKFP